MCVCVECACGRERGKRVLCEWSVCVCVCVCVCMYGCIYFTYPLLWFCLCSRHTIDDIISLWSKLQNTSKEECVRLYLQRVRRIPAFGFRYFQVTCRSLSGSSRATIAVGEDCIKVLNYSSSSQVCTCVCLLCKDAGPLHVYRTQLVHLK